MRSLRAICVRLHRNIGMSQLTFLAEGVDLLFARSESSGVRGVPNVELLGLAVLVVGELLDSALGWKLALERRVTDG